MSKVTSLLFWAVVLLVPAAAWSQSPLESSSLWALLGAGLLGLITHFVKDLIAYRTANPTDVNSYFSGNWPQLVLAVLGILGMVLIPGVMGEGTVVTALTAYYAGIAGGSLSTVGAPSWGERVS